MFSNSFPVEQLRFPASPADYNGGSFPLALSGQYWYHSNGDRNTSMQDPFGIPGQVQEKARNDFETIYKEFVNRLGSPLKPMSHETDADGNERLIFRSSDPNQSDTVITIKRDGTNEVVIEYERVNGDVLVEATLKPDKTLQLVEIDRSNTQSWDTRTVTTDANGNVVSDKYDFASTTTNYLTTTHTAGDFKLDTLTEAQAAQITAQLERELMDGGRIGDHKVNPEQYNADPVSGHGLATTYSDFSAGGYGLHFGASDNIDATPGTWIEDTSVAYTSDFDRSSTNDGFQNFNYDAPTDAVPTANTFDLDIALFDPILLDLSPVNATTGKTNGVRMLSRQDSTAHFDVNGSNDRFREKTAWMDGAAGTGMLVRDRPSTANDILLDGLISRLDEISFSTKPGQTDLEGLALYDTNKDGKLSAADGLDAAGNGWSALSVWVDANADGRAETSEVKTLAQWGIIPSE